MRLDNVSLNYIVITKWLNFILNHSKKTIIQIPELLEVYQSTNKDAPFFFTNIGNGGFLK